MKQYHQNQTITTVIEVSNDQHIKSSTMTLTRGVEDIYQRVLTKNADQQKLFVVLNWQAIHKKNNQVNILLFPNR